MKDGVQKALKIVSHEMKLTFMLNIFHVLVIVSYRTWSKPILRLYFEGDLTIAYPTIYSNLTLLLTMHNTKQMLSERHFALNRYIYEQSDQPNYLVLAHNIHIFQTELLQNLRS